MGSMGSMGSMKDYLDFFIDVERLSPLWVAPFPRQGILSSIKKKKASKELSNQPAGVHLFPFPLDCGCDVM